MTFLAYVSILNAAASDLYRVETPNHPMAISTSTVGSVLSEPPTDGSRWRYEHTPVLDKEPFVAPLAIDVMNVSLWHENGSTGAGVKIAVFDYQWFGVDQKHLGLEDVHTHDCWAHPSCERPFDTLEPKFEFEDGSHGVACAEVIKAIAPEADLHLVRVNGLTTLENAIDWAIREQVDLISISMSYFNYSFYDGTGTISEVSAKLAEHGVLMITSSGNYANSHWRGEFTDLDGDGRMDFNGENGLWIYFSEGSHKIYVNWDQFDECGLTDLNAALRTDSGDFIGYSEDKQEMSDTSHCEPTEKVKGQVAETGWTFLEVYAPAGLTSGIAVDVMATTGEVWEGVEAFSIADPGMEPTVIAVGAVDVDGYLINQAQYYSSQGPLNSLTPKPEIAGPDGLTTFTYGPRGFFGTSAAAPAVTGVTALTMSEDPSLTPREAMDRVRSWSWSPAQNEFSADPELGDGKARLPVNSTDNERGCFGKASYLPLLFTLPFWRQRRSAKTKNDKDQNGATGGA